MCCAVLTKDNLFRFLTMFPRPDHFIPPAAGLIAPIPVPVERGREQVGPRVQEGQRIPAGLVARALNPRGGRVRPAPQRRRSRVQNVRNRGQDYLPYGLDANNILPNRLRLRQEL